MAEPIIRHGEGMHFMRPDRVYRTSVLSPMYGYQPQADVQHVAMAFTQGPERAMMLQGLGAMPGPIQRFFSQMKAWIARKKAEKLMQVPRGGSPPFVPPGQGGTFMPPGQIQGMPGPASVQAYQISPHLAMQMAGVMNLAQVRYGQGYPNTAASALVYRRLVQWYG